MVGIHEGESLSRQFNCSFLETSARNKINVEESYYQLVRVIRDEDKRPDPSYGVSKKDRREKKRKERNWRCLMM